MSSLASSRPSSASREWRIEKVSKLCCNLEMVIVLRSKVDPRWPPSSYYRTLLKRLFFGAWSTFKSWTFLQTSHSRNCWVRIMAQVRLSRVSALWGQEEHVQVAGTTVRSHIRFTFLSRLVCIAESTLGGTESERVRLTRTKRSLQSEDDAVWSQAVSRWIRVAGLDYAAIDDRHKMVAFWSSSQYQIELMLRGSYQRFTREAVKSTTENNHPYAM